jgi:organic radical activating enzyme
MAKYQDINSSLAITTIIGCKNRCSYCPQKTVIKAYTAISKDSLMSLENFKKYISTIPKNITLSFAGFSEPWINIEATAMLLHANKNGFPIRVNTTLIGMRTEDVEKMEQVPFIKFAVHLPDNSNHTKINVDSIYLETLESLLKSNIKNQFFKYHKENDIDLHPEVKKVFSKFKAKITSFGLNNRAGYSKTEYQYAQPNKGKILKACEDFKHNILLPNGDVALCHMDWNLKHILGNLSEISYPELYTSDEFKKIQNALLNPNSDLLCRQCEKDIVKRNLIIQKIKNISDLIKGEKLY